VIGAATIVTNEVMAGRLEPAMQVSKRKVQG
jgi:hypothetical protein